MFEEKKWSQKLRDEITKFLQAHTRCIMGSIIEIASLVEVALGEGEYHVLDDPKHFNLGNCEDCEERRLDEPTRDESRD